MNMTEKAIDYIIARCGEEAQMVVAIEELSELQKELCKFLRDKGNRNHLIEEVSDVELMLLQVKMIFDIPQERINEIIGKKIQRTLDRLSS